MSKKQIQQKIIAGKYKNRVIQLPSLDTTRSTKSIIKESLFNTLQYDVVGENFIEVFGGSGSMGLEALSRGAKKAYFIEKDIKAFEILKLNCNTIAPKDTNIILGDSFIKLPELLDQIEQKSYMYVDPPFHIREGMDDIYTKTIELISNISTSRVHMIVVEHISNIQLPENIGNFILAKKKKFGKTTLTYYSP